MMINKILKKETGPSYTSTTFSFSALRPPEPLLFRTLIFALQPLSTELPSGVITLPFPHLCKL